MCVCRRGARRDARSRRAYARVRRSMSVWRLLLSGSLSVFTQALCKVVVLEPGLSQRSLEALYRRADVLAMPTRGEGWGRPHVEAMASGTPVIATNWSGPTAFLTESNGYPLSIDGLELVGGDGPFADHQWAAPSPSHLAELCCGGCVVVFRNSFWDTLFFSFFETTRGKV